MSLLVDGGLTLVHGRDTIRIRPSRRTVLIDVPSLRSGLRLLRTLWRQRAVVRRAMELVEGSGIELAVRYRAREFFRSKPMTTNHQEEEMADHRNDTQNWPDLAAGLYDKLTGRGAEINYRFEELEVAVPSRTGEGAEHASWKLNGAIRISTQEAKS